MDLQQVAGLWTPEQRHLHINILELLAVRLALQHFQQQVANHSVVIMTDNSTVVAQICNQGGTHSRQLHRQTALLLSWADNHSVHLLPRHIPGHLNVLAVSVVPSSASGSEHRVDTCPTSSDPPMASVGSTTRGHVCHSQQRQTTRVCLSTSGPPGMEGRRLLLSLGEPGYVSVPTDATHRRSPASHSIGQLPCHPDCPSLADPVLVPTTAVSGRRSPKTPSDNSHPPSPAAHGPVSSGPATSSSSRVATIQSALERRGYSASVAGRIASSPQTVYPSGVRQQVANLLRMVPGR